MASRSLANAEQAAKARRRQRALEYMKPTTTDEDRREVLLPPGGGANAASSPPVQQPRFAPPKQSGDQSELGLTQERQESASPVTARIQRYLRKSKDSAEANASIIEDAADRQSPHIARMEQLFEKSTLRTTTTATATTTEVADLEGRFTSPLATDGASVSSTKSTPSPVKDILAISQRQSTTRLSRYSAEDTMETKDMKKTKASSRDKREQPTTRVSRFTAEESVNTPAIPKENTEQSTARLSRFAMEETTKTTLSSEGNRGQSSTRLSRFIVEATSRVSPDLSKIPQKHPTEAKDLDSILHRTPERSHKKVPSAVTQRLLGDSRSTSQEPHTPRTSNTNTAARVHFENPPTSDLFEGDTDSSLSIETLEGGDVTGLEKPEVVASGNELLDASRLTHHGIVVLKQGASAMAVDKHGNASLGGLGIALEVRGLSITIRYGLPVSLFAPSLDMYLGVSMPHGLIGFYSKSPSESEKWTILHGDRLLLVGSGAVKFAKRSHGQVVRSGDSIVLRNQSTGGLLSVRDGKFELLTQSYNSDFPGQESLLDRALSHDHIHPSEHEFVQIWHAHVPPCPSWANGRDKKELERIEDRILPKAIRDQETLLLDQIVGALMGIDGSVIYRNENMRYVVGSKDIFDRSKVSLVERVLPICSGFIFVQDFLDGHDPGFEYGSVMQALCEEVNAILSEYLDQVCEVEGKLRDKSTRFTLNQLFVETQHLAKTTDLLENVVREVREAKGGALINILRNLSMLGYAGDEVKQALLRRLLEKSSVPYMKMLSSWLRSGVFRDPCGEFMIQRLINKDIDGDTWSTTFSLKPENVLDGILSADFLKRKVLTTGKYWNAIQHCENISDVAPNLMHGEESHLDYMGDSSSISSCISKMHQRASSSLLKLLLSDFRLEKTLITLKRYFLLDQGDFLLYFLDAAESELSKRTEEVSRGRTQHWLNMAIQFSEPSTDDSESKATVHLKEASQPLSAYSIRSKFALESLDVLLGVRQEKSKTPSRYPYGTVSGLTGMMSFMLDFAEIPFPTSLIVSQQSLTHYQMLFRHIFYAKYVEQRLVGVWLDHQMMKEFQAIRALLGPTFCLRQRMLHFVQNFIYYMMLEVVEPNWLELMKGINKQETVDDLMESHKEFLEKTLEQCLLTNPAMIQSLTKLLSTCLLFAEQLKRFVEKTGIADDTKIMKQKREAARRHQYRMEKVKKDKESLKKAMHAQRAERKARTEKQASIIERELQNESYKRMILRYEAVFDDSLGEFIRNLRSKVGDKAHISNLCIRLDFNGFVSKGRSSKW